MLFHPAIVWTSNCQKFAGKKAAMPEILKISGLGPIKNLKIEVKPLTVLVGPQASGKSLAAQVLYFFRTLQSEFDQRYKRENTEEKGWQGRIVGEILDELRGTPFFQFTNKNTLIQFIDTSYLVDWQMKTGINGKLLINNSLTKHMQNWADTWKDRASSIGIPSFTNKVFIPTERAIISLFIINEMSIIYRSYLPLPFRKFMAVLDYAERQYEKILTQNKIIHLFDDREKNAMFLELCRFEQNALKGQLSYKRIGNQKGWEFSIPIMDDDVANVIKQLPLSAITSGQMEAWPFFAAALTLGVEFSDTSFIFEEPETHLHPAAQRIIVETIAYLVNRKRQFFVTTHSPYILYTINNLMQAHISYGGKVPEGAAYLDPKDVAAYRLTADGKAVSIIDKDTGLMESAELDETADRLGDEFDDLLNIRDRRHGK